MKQSHDEGRVCRRPRRNQELFDHVSDWGLVDASEARFSLTMMNSSEHEMVPTSTWLRKLWLVSTAAVVSTFVVANVQAGTPVFLGNKASRKEAMDKIDHTPWDALLKKYVDDNGRVNYRSLKSNANDLQTLRRYLDSLSQASPQAFTSRDAKLAFWINAYNAVTMHGILREYPTTSIRNHTAKLFGFNIWHDLQLYVGGTPYSLDTIEHKILRKMGEPRIHFAIVCASIGCPRLLHEAYSGDRLDEQLEANARDFFARTQNFRYDSANKRFYLSAILDWFGEDFGSSQATRIQLISRWLPSTAAKLAAQQNAARISYLDYNWNLNEQ